MHRPLLFLCLAFLLWPAGAAAITIHIAAPEVPDRYAVGSAIIDNSDTLVINAGDPVPRTDYSVDYRRGLFDLSGLELAPGDTLSVTFTPLPSWLKSRYGRALPEPGDSPRRETRLPPPARSSSATPFGSDVNISGAKSFRFSSRTAGVSEFSQSLDLALSGELTPGLSITGAVTDRGFDPAYGTANSRLNELSKINLTLQSRTFTGQVGDLTLDSRGIVSGLKSKRISGAYAVAGNRTWYAEAAAARPRGSFESTQFYGRDGVQGPYRVTPRSEPVVPGSEQVWLDGRMLQRGTNEAYTMDYPAGTVTFNVNHPIDSRSRIEIDYEPQATDYRGELFSSGGGVALRDSSVVIEIGWLREGDDRGEPLAGDLSESDRSLLAAVGDSVAGARRSGVRPDSSGAYLLVADSLPDSVYRYVGAGAGDYSITFTFVGLEGGTYRNLGAGRFEYVGEGGDYLPVVVVPAPQRIDSYASRLTWRDRSLGTLVGEYRRSDFDRNLFSPLDDGNNDGELYSAAWQRSWQWHGRANSINVSTRRRAAEYRQQGRLYAPEFNRSLLLPASFVPSSDERLHRAALAVSPVSGVLLSPGLEYVEYDDGTIGRLGRLAVDLEPHSRVRLNVGWQNINTDLRSTEADGAGEGTVLRGSADWAPGGRWKLGGEYTFDQRENDYAGTPAGTRFHEGRLTVDRGTETVTLQRYQEDSLTVGWTGALTRTRVELRSQRRFQKLNYSATLAHHWLERPSGDERAFLGRLNLGFADIARRLAVTTSYLVSEETRNARGLTFIEVDPGRGDYILEDGRYVPDPDGNYLRVEEILSEQQRVSRAEKSFQFSKDWSVARIRFSSRIEEELLEDGDRSVAWVLPFYSDPDQPYQFYQTRYHADIRAFPIRHAHAVNVTIAETREVRTVASTNRQKLNREAALMLKQAVGQTYLEQSVEWFSTDRDEYFTGAGDFDGYTLGVSWRRLIGAHELTAGGAYRSAESDFQERSEQYVVRAGSRVAVVRRGELRTSLELYLQNLTGVTGTPSYTLTNNRSGQQGATWNVELRYGVRKNLRIRLTMTGRHSDNRTARVTARGEMIAEF